MTLDVFHLERYLQKKKNVRHLGTPRNMVTADTIGGK